MANILDKIFEDKRDELSGTKRSVPLSELKSRIGDQAPVKDIFKALRSGPGSKIIAEIKRRTPFKGELRQDIGSMEIAQAYTDGGAAAISILTESSHFGGSLSILSQAKREVDIPLLRKDFIFDEYQVYESLAFGADFFLLIATWLDTNHMADLLDLGEELGIPALVETHDELDVERAFSSGAKLIGINNRDLTSGKTDLGVSRRLIKVAKSIPESTVVCESGIRTHEDIEGLEKLGAHAFLIGESLMTAENIGEKLKGFVGNGNSSTVG